MRAQSKADLVMLLVTLFWGSSYLFMKMGLQSMQPFHLIFWRFGIAFLLSALVFYRRIVRVDRKTVWYAFILGCLLFGVFATVFLGLQTTSAAKAGFLVSLTVLFVPFLSAVILKQRPETKVVVGAFLALAGIGFLTWNGHISLEIGDIFCILCALFYAIHIVVTGILTKGVDSVALGVLQLGFTGALGLTVACFTETPKLPDSFTSWISILALGILCSAFGFIAQTVAQNYTTPTHTGLIFSLEPVFAALFAVLFAGETLSTKGYIGASLVMIGVLFAEVNVESFLQKKKSTLVKMRSGRVG
jgi:drug/metabolite transporter (DMT)-like permease